MQNLNKFWHNFSARYLKIATENLGQMVKILKGKNKRLRYFEFTFMIHLLEIYYLSEF